MGLRFVLPMLIAFAVLLSGNGHGSGTSSLLDIAHIAAAAFALITLPGFALQLGIARASPQAVNSIRALGPVCVFAVQQLDDRLTFSGATLACVAVFSCGAIVGGVLGALFVLACAIGAFVFLRRSRPHPTTRVPTKTGNEQYGRFAAEI